MLAVVCAAAPGAAVAHRPASAGELGAIRRAVLGATHGAYCPGGGAVDVSTIDRRWAAAFAIGNCGAGSSEVRFYLRRGGRGWRIRETRSAQGVGSVVPCADRTVPADIRCGVRGRS